MTGQVTAYFEDLPQAPFDDFQLHLFASDRGLMATPTQCTIYTTTAHFFPWNATLADQTSSQIFGLDSGPNGTECPGQVRPFNPSLVAGTSNPVAGAFSSFTLKLDRDDGDQFLGDLNFTMPPGFTGDLRGISYCPEASIAHAAQNPGRTEQAIPQLPGLELADRHHQRRRRPRHPPLPRGRQDVPGRPVQGAPLSLVAITPALAGPYDYGTVVVRVALHVDPLDAHVIAVSDTVPSIIGGIPIRMRSIQVNIDKPNFTINPTNCSPLSVDSQGIGDQGTVADFSSYFHAVNCATLRLQAEDDDHPARRPQGHRRATNPSLQFDLRTRPGDANIKSLSVTLSSAFEIDQRHLGNICSEKELAANQCAGPHADRQGDDDDAAARPAALRPGLRGLGLGRPAEARLHPQRPGQPRPRAETKTITKGGGPPADHRPGRPRRPDRPLPPDRLRRQDRLPGQHPRHLRQRPVTKVAYTAQNGKTLSPPRGPGNNRQQPPQPPPPNPQKKRKEEGAQKKNPSQIRKHDGVFPCFFRGRRARALAARRQERTRRPPPPKGGK